VLTASLKGPEGVCPRGKGSRGRRRHGILDNYVITLSRTQKETCQGKIGPSEQFGPTCRAMRSNDGHRQFGQMLEARNGRRIRGEGKWRDMGVDVTGSNCWHSPSNSRMEYVAPVLTSSARGEAKDDVRLQVARRSQPSSLNEGYTDHASGPNGRCICMERA